MVKPRRLKPLPIFDQPALLAFLEERGVKPKHAGTVVKHIINHRPQTIEEIDLSGTKSDRIPTGLVQALATTFVVTTSRVVEVRAYC
jgi:hypothetical protein